MVFNSLSTQDIDAVLIVSPYSALYFSGYKNPDCCIFATPDKTYYLTDARYTKEARKAIPEDFELVDASRQLFNTVGNLASAHRVKRLGIEENALPLAAFRRYDEALKDITLSDISENIERLRTIKREDELELIAKAAQITDIALSMTLPEIKEGISELELAYILQLNLVRSGASGVAFDTICVFGENTSNPHGHPSARTLRHGDAVTIDFGAVYNGYCSDLTRSMFFGQPSAEYRKVYAIVKEANERAIDALFAGLTGQSADAVARRFIEENGYGEYFLHSLGHGIGVEVHEKPYLAKTSVDILDNNMVFSVEPGIYVEQFGVRIEDLVAIRNNKAVVLSRSDKNLIII